MVCSKCKEDKNLECFSKNQKQCKACKKEFYIKNKEKIVVKSKKTYANNKSIVLEKQKEYYKNNKIERKLYQKNYEILNKDKIQKYNEEYYQKNKEKIKKSSTEWIKEKYKNNQEFRIQTKLHLQIVKYLHQHQNINKIPQILGYEIKDFINKIGSPKKGYDIDHKIPLSWFENFTPINIIWDLRNLHIIKSQENKKKGNRFAHPITEEYKNSIKQYIKTKYQSKL
jgi:hypothetical protein